MKWFLPETPDVLGLLRAELAVTIEAMDAFGRWAGGEAAAEQDRSPGPRPEFGPPAPRPARATAPEARGPPAPPARPARPPPKWAPHNG